LIPVKELQRKKYADSWLDLTYGKPENGRVIRLPILSGSMSPQLIPGDIISIQCITWRECKIGDIIVFKSSQGLTAHRLLLRFQLHGKCYFYQKGDGNRFGGLIDSDSVMGVVVQSENSIGNITFLRNAEETKRFRNLAMYNLKKDVINRLLYLPKILLPYRVKQIIKQYIGRK
jgi:signal peptidase I